MFFTLQIPLSRFSPGFAFLTSFIVWFLDDQSKAWVYRLCQSADLESLKSMFKRRIDYDEPSMYRDSTPNKKDDFRAVVDWFWLHLSIMASICLNFLYRVTMENTIADAAHTLITASDSIGLDLHFVRFLYWTLLPQDGVNHNPIFFSDVISLALLAVLYWKAFSFLLSPINSLYDGRVNSIIAPLSLLPMLFCQSGDIMFMGIHTLLINLYVSYYVIDPDAQDDYSKLRSDRRSLDTYVGDDSVTNSVL